MLSAPVRRDAATDSIIALVATLPDCLQTAMTNYANGALTEASVRRLCAGLADGSLIEAVTPILVNACPADALSASLPALTSLKTDCDAVIAAIPATSADAATTTDVPTADASASESASAAESTNTNEVSAETTASGSADAAAPTTTAAGAAASSKAPVSSAASAKASGTAKATAAATATASAAAAASSSKSSAGQVVVSVFGAVAALFML
ncbi:hypothetical protein HDU81_010965 [Chytriomyces hyalinus]|nr:hypothetical protein HDU81_010965 [Chytriomyces hyalinus]